MEESASSINSTGCPVARLTDFRCKGVGMPICIAGMHRSGTSMVARLLNLCSLYLGPETELVGAAPGNEEGFWENGLFVRLNEDALAQLGGGWDLPPAMTEG
jgi:hypothetical protein